MNRIVSFIKGKGFYLALALCVAAAAGSSFWAIRNVMDNMREIEKPPVKQEVPTPWQQPQIKVEEKVTDVPKPSAKPSQPLPSQSGSGNVQSKQSDLQESAAGAEPSFVRPVAGKNAKPFSGDELVYNRTLNDWRTHNGLDITCAADAQVKSAVAGKVCNIYEDDMWGLVVDVQADDVVWRYTGLDKATLQVKTGDALKAGQPIAKIGTAEAEIGEAPHLHLEVLKGGNYVDPEHYFE